MGMGSGAPSVAVARIASTAAGVAMETGLVGTGLALFEVPTSAYIGMKCVTNLPTVAYDAGTPTALQ
jgi:hypothetical protein